jgi:hypothetical protein
VALLVQPLTVAMAAMAMIEINDLLITNPQVFPALL